MCTDVSVATFLYNSFGLPKFLGLSSSIERNLPRILARADTNDLCAGTNFTHLFHCGDPSVILITKLRSVVMAIQCSTKVDGTFGPTVSGCRDDFDFTMLFEDTFFAMVPSAILLLAAPFQLVELSRQGPILLRGRLLPCKLALAIAWFTIQIALLVGLTLNSQRPLGTTMAAAACSVVDGVTICVLSYFSHTRSATPSTLLQSYLGLSLLLDVPRLRTSWLQLPYGPTSILSIISMLLKLFLFAAEALGKQRLLRAGLSFPSPESMIGLVNRSVFWWLNEILLTGMKRPLKAQDIYEINAELAARTVYDQLRDKVDTSELFPP